MRPDRSTVTTSPSSILRGRASARGSWTSTPPCSIGAVIMKMMSSTKATSTSEVTLMSAVRGTAPRRRPRPPPSPPAILEQPLARHRADQLVGEAVELPLEDPETGREIVVRHHRWDRRGKARHRRDQRLGHPRRHGGQIPGATGRDPEKGRHHAEDGPEEAKEGTDRADGGEPRDVPRRRVTFGIDVLGEDHLERLQLGRRQRSLGQLSLLLER